MLYTSNHEIRCPGGSSLSGGPALAHLNGLLPALESLVGIRSSNLGFENSPSFGVDVLEVVKGLPDTSGKAGGDGGTKGSCLAHGRSVDGNANDIRLGLDEKKKDSC